MLALLRIKDLATIDTLELELGPGLNVLTGEAGAGKSVLVSALELALGGKARAELVRAGAGAGEVEALFTAGALPGGASASGEASGGVSASGSAGAGAREGALRREGGGGLLVRRIVSAGGRSRAFVGGKRVTRRGLVEATHGLVDVSSQHEHHTLCDPGTHGWYLDAFAGAVALRGRMSRAYGELRRAEAALRELRAHTSDRESRESALRAELEAIEAVGPEPGEDEVLESRCVRLRGMESLVRLSGEAAELLSERDDSVVDAFSQVERRVSEAAKLDERLGPLSARLTACEEQLMDASRELSHYVHGARADPAELGKAEERLDALFRLRRRYGGSLEAVLARREQLERELERLDKQTVSSEALVAARDRALECAHGVAQQLSRVRRRAAGELGGAITRELESMGMSGAAVRVELEPAAAALEDGAPEAMVGGVPFSAEGLERAELSLAANRGEPPRPLRQVASGGELSRAMLAIKCVLAELLVERGGLGSAYAFDEVDSGVGGATAEIVGRKIRSLAQHRQVLCITHLPQIAVFADHHFKVEKALQGRRTRSTVRLLESREQREEIARMLGGLTITSRTRAAAREMLCQARRTAA